MRISTAFHRIKKPLKKSLGGQDWIRNSPNLDRDERRNVNTVRLLPVQNEKDSNKVESFSRCPGLDSNQHILANAAT